MMKNEIIEFAGYQYKFLANGSLRNVTKNSFASKKEKEMVLKVIEAANKLPTEHFSIRLISYPIAQPLEEHGVEIKTTIRLVV